LRLKKDSVLVYNIDVYAVIGIISILRAFNEDLKVHIDTFMRFKRNDERNDFRKYKNDIMKLLVHEGNAVAESHKHHMEYAELHKERDNVLNYYASLIKNEDNIPGSVSAIMLSVIHMFCNRLNSNPIWERRIMSLTYYAIYNFSIAKKRQAPLAKETEL
jgi:thiopeptide-type bacteriocin biosynthesis protein